MWEEFRGCEAHLNTGALDPAKDVSVGGTTEEKQPGCVCGELFHDRIL